ncbi:hypothetical protein BB560_003470 [Smittium megazygosporum]|uniref:Threonine/serine exporter-like N-terminal domain-containing protein n=1 Tax=Smittium megazygosporum TaxID=133381 RepID=A0A2T9ZBV7_9FUNG|nr:hypothetical protein BB560_003470 [Smittium megazygosporum]
MDSKNNNTSENNPSDSSLSNVSKGSSTFKSHINAIEVKDLEANYDSLSKKVLIKNLKEKSQNGHYLNQDTNPSQKYKVPKENPDLKVKSSSKPHLKATSTSNQRNKSTKKIVLESKVNKSKLLSKPKFIKYTRPSFSGDLSPIRSLRNLESMAKEQLESVSKKLVTDKSSTARLERVAGTLYRKAKASAQNSPLDSDEDLDYYLKNNNSGTNSFSMSGYTTPSRLGAHINQRSISAHPEIISPRSSFTGPSPIIYNNLRKQSVNPEIRLTQLFDRTQATQPIPQSKNLSHPLDYLQTEIVKNRSFSKSNTPPLEMSQTRTGFDSDIDLEKTGSRYKYRDFVDDYIFPDNTQDGLNPNMNNRDSVYSNEKYDFSPGDNPYTNGFASLSNYMSDFKIKIKLLSKFSYCLLNYGAPSYRLEASLDRMAKFLGVNATFKCFPRFIMIALNKTKENSAGTIVVDANPSIDFHKMNLIDALFEDVMSSKIDFKQALNSIIYIQKTPSLYPWWTTLIIGFILPMCYAQYAFKGDIFSILASSLLGGIVGLLSFYSSKFEGFKNVLQFAAAYLVSLVACALRKHTCYYTVTLSSIASQLPGLSLTIGIMEIVAGSVISGTARVIKSIITLLTLSYSIQLGEDTFKQIFGKSVENLVSLDRSTCPQVQTNRLFTILFVPIAIICSLVLQNTSHRNIPLCMFIACSMYGLFYVLNNVVKLNSVSTIYSAFFAGLLSNISSRIWDVAPFIPLVCSVSLLVPGSLGLTSISGLLDPSSNSPAIFFRVFVICLAIMIGLFSASFVVFPKGRNKAASLTF